MSEVVTTKDELKRALEAKEDEIIIRGELAKTLKNASAITKLSAVGVAALSAAIAAAGITAPVTGGLSLAAAAPIAAIFSGMESVTIVAIVTIGLTVVVGLFKDYEVTFKITSPNGTTMEAVLTKK